MAYKYFLGLSPEDKMIDPSLLTKFRKPRTALSRGERTAAYFINVPMIISIIYLLYTTYTFITWPS